MRYLKVLWHHDFETEPVELYSEIDDEGYESRKVEIYRDGRCDYADENRTTGTTFLGEKPIPEIDEIASQREFSPVVISAEEFEQVWQTATADPF